MRVCAQVVIGIMSGAVFVGLMVRGHDGFSALMLEGHHHISNQYQPGRVVKGKDTAPSMQMLLTIVRLVTYGGQGGIGMLLLG